MCYPVCGMLHIKEPLARLEIKIAGVPVTMSYTNQFVFDVREIVPVTKIPKSVNVDSSCTVDDDFNSLPPESASRDSNSTINHIQS